MKATLFALFVALLMVGCGEDSKKPTEDSPESNESSAETPPAKSPEVGGIDLDDNETRNRIIAEAIELSYKPSDYTGWVKWMHDNGQITGLVQFKDDKEDGPATSWYENGQKSGEGTWKDGKLVTSVVWKPNGEKCPHTNVVNGNGVMVYYNDDGTEAFRQTF